MNRIIDWCAGKWQAFLAIPNLKAKFEMTFIGLAFIVACYLPILDKVLSLMDEPTSRYMDSIKEQALMAYFIAAALNGGISMIQGTELSMSIGFGLTLKPGELIDWANDLVEKLADILLIAISAIYAEDFLSEVTTWLGTRVFTAGAILLFIIGMWLPTNRMNFKILACRFLLVGILLKLIFPLSALVGVAVTDRFLAPRYEQSIKGLETMQKKIEELNQERMENGDAKKEQHWLDKFKDSFGVTGAWKDFKNKFWAMLNFSKAMVKYFATLVAVFLIKVLILPAGTIGLIYALTTYTLRRIFP